MPYALVFDFIGGVQKKLAPLVPDNPESRYGFEDKKIKRNAEKVAAGINKTSKDVSVWVEHYV